MAYTFILYQIPFVYTIMHAGTSAGGPNLKPYDYKIMAGGVDCENIPRKRFDMATLSALIQSNIEIGISCSNHSWRGQPCIHN